MGAELGFDGEFEFAGDSITIDGSGEAHKHFAQHIFQCVAVVSIIGLRLHGQERRQKRQCSNQEHDSIALKWFHKAPVKMQNGKGKMEKNRNERRTMLYEGTEE